MNVTERAKLERQQKNIDIAIASAHSADAPNRLLRKLTSGKKDNVIAAPAATPTAPTPAVDTVAMQNYVNSLTPEGLKALSDMVKKALEARDSVVQSSAPAPPAVR